MTFDKLNRRGHLYLGLFLMPWLIMYGVSSFIITHEPWFGGNKEKQWEPVFERPYDLSLNTDKQEELRKIGEKVLKENNMEGAFWVNKSKPDQLEIDRYSFWGSTHFTYSAKDHTLQATRQRSRIPQVIMRMHFRGGYDQPTFLDKFWGFLVDLACVGIIIWVFSGLLMWWRLPKFRAWGAIAVAGGFLSFFALLWTL